MGVSKRFLFTILLIGVIAAVAGAAIFLAKGYRFSTQSGKITGTGIISITSVPDQASVYLDGHLTTATNDNIEALVPKKYQVRVVKEGFIPWEKEIEVKEGLVEQLKITLFPAIPTIYPLTFNGVYNPVLSPDDQKVVFAVPGAEKKSGVWVWTMSVAGPINIGRGGEPHQVALSQPGIDYTKAVFRWSPDSTQIMVTLSDRTLLLNQESLNDPPRDITAILQPTINAWNEEEKNQQISRIGAIQDLQLRKITSASASLKSSPDETKLLYNESGNGFKVSDLVDKKTYTLPSIENIRWLPTSEHLILVEPEGGSTPNPATPSASLSKVSIIEYDGTNKQVLYVGNLDPNSVFPWPDGSRVMIVSSLPTPTAKEPNFYGINLK